MKQLVAEEGKVYTDGEIYGREICLPDSVDASVFRQVDESEMPKENQMKYSRWGIIKALEKRGLADQFDAYLTANKAAFRRFYGPQFFLSDDADFKEMLKTFQDAFSLSDDYVAAILAESPYTPE